MRRLLLLLLSLFALPAWSAAPDGAELFARNCAVCHGDHGHGGVGIPLALPDFLAVVSNDYLEKTIRSGRPGRVMPSFSHLSNAEVKAIVATIRSWQPKGTQPVKDDRTPIRGDAAHGKALFAQHCAVCHGPSGGGGHGTGVTFSRPRDLPIIPPALNNAGFLNAASDQMIKHTLMRGRTGTPMKSFLKQGMSEKDIDDVVAYVRSFQAHPMERDKLAGNIDPVIRYESPYSVEETVKAVRRAIVGKNFLFIRQQYVNQGLVPAGKEDKKQVIIYFCNFDFLYKALALDPRVGMFLPCRVTITEEHGKVMLTSINPERLSALFNNNELDQACAEMTQTYKDIMEEATL